MEGMDMRHLLFLIMMLCLILPLMGCTRSEPDAPKLVPVTGTVMLDGKALAQAQIRFVPTGDTKGFGSTGTTDSDGKYALKGQRGGNGAVAGSYKVVISKRVMPDGSPPTDDKAPMESAAREILPPKYSVSGQTSLTATVPPEGGTVDFPLKSR
jgi:hypothetical protein